MFARPFAAVLTALLFLPAPAPAADPAAPADLVEGGEQWVAVGYGGRRMVSTDGRTWEVTAEWAEDGGDDSNNLMSLARGRGRWVAVGGGGWSRDTQAGHILVSEDGRTWRQVLKTKNRVNPVVFGPDAGADAGPDGAGLFVAGGPDRTLLISADAEEWAPGYQVPADGFPAWAFWFRHGAYGNGTFVFLGQAGKNKEFYWSLATADGAAASFRGDLPPLSALAFGAADATGVGRFVAVGKGVTAVSRDGREWAVTERPGFEKVRWLVWTGEEFLCGGGGGPSFRSADGLEWDPSPLKPRGNLLWSDGKRFIATGWPGKMFRSDDGTAWTPSPPLPPNGINKVLRRPADR